MKFLGASDGRQYPESRFDSGSSSQAWTQDWVRRLRSASLEELGLLALLGAHWPEACAVEHGGQVSSYFLADFEWSRVVAIVGAESLPMLQRLESGGAIWIVRRGSEVLWLEPRDLDATGEPSAVRPYADSTAGITSF